MQFICPAPNPLYTSVMPRHLSAVLILALLIVGLSQAAPEVSSALPKVGAADTPRRVLLVVAHRDFFFQEYNDPRKALEASGIKPVVASTRERCVPHPNTGQAPGTDGAIKADVLLKDVKADEYVAIVFVGGWGASMYQPGFKVKYDNGEYNSGPEVKARVNELVAQFTKADKYVGGICHGVTVLAYCKVDGNSLIKNKKLSGPAIGGPGFTGADGKRMPDMAVKSKWHIEENGGVFVPLNSVGDPAKSEDDVTVDGRLITAQDNTSALKFGQVLGELLNKQ